jgi:cation diffusion facilitator family transporter
VTPLAPRCRDSLPQRTENSAPAHTDSNAAARKKNSPKLAQREGIVSIIVNFVLFALKMWAGLLSGSIALIADAWHTLSDSLGSVAVVIAAKLSARKPDRKHPFGHGRWEQIAALFIAFLLAFVAFDFLIESITRFSHGGQAQFGTFAIVVTLVSVIVKEALAQYAFHIARKTDNVSVKADGWHHRADALSSLVVLAGIAFAGYFDKMDSVLGIVVSLMLFHAAYEIVKETITKLLGEEPDETLIAGISEIIISMYGEDLRPHHFHIHNYVSHRELTLHIKLDNDLTIEAGHRVATEIETAIKSQFGITATIHVEPKR